MTPSPPAPTRAAMTTIERLSMMHCVMPAKMRGAALGIFTLQEQLQRVAPKDMPASSNGLGTPLMPSWVRRTGAGSAKMIGRDQRRHHA